VARGYTQVKKIDFDETVVLIACLEFVRILLVISCHLNFKLYHMDVQNAFLNKILKENVYVEQPKDFTNHLFHNHVYRLKIALYGLQ